MGIERIHPYGKGEQIRILAFQVFHVGEPFRDKQYVRPFDVASNMDGVSRGQFVQIFPRGQLLGQMKNRPEQLGEGFMFEKVWVFQKPE